jgi:formylmethanofuran dehydrogenase subunit B
LTPYRTRKSEKMSENGKNRAKVFVWAGIDSSKAVQETMSKERLFVARKGKQSRTGILSPLPVDKFW